MPLQTLWLYIVMGHATMELNTRHPHGLYAREMRICNMKIGSNCLYFSNTETLSGRGQLQRRPGSGALVVLAATTSPLNLATAKKQACTEEVAVFYTYLYIALFFLHICLSDCRIGFTKLAFIAIKLHTSTYRCVLA